MEYKFLEKTILACLQIGFAQSHITEKAFNNGDINGLFEILDVRFYASSSFGQY